MVFATHQIHPFHTMCSPAHTIKEREVDRIKNLQGPTERRSSLQKEWEEGGRKNQKLSREPAAATTCLSEQSLLRTDHDTSEAQLVEILSEELALKFRLGQETCPSRQRHDRGLGPWLILFAPPPRHNHGSHVPEGTTMSAQPLLRAWCRKPRVCNQRGSVLVRRRRLHSVKRMGALGQPSGTQACT